MATLKFAVIGHPVAHSLSPKMHAANFAALGPLSLPRLLCPAPVW